MHSLSFTRILVLMSLILICISQDISAQKNYKPAQIITLNNDTISGLIDYRNWSYNPNKINFKNDENSKAKTLFPLDIHAFLIDDEYYIGAIVQAETSPRNSYNLNTNPQLQLETDTTFLKSLFIGNKSLLHYKSRSGNDNFYISHQLDLILLIYKKFIKKFNHDREYDASFDKIEEIDKYKNQLHAYLNNCPDIANMIDRISYSENSLLKLFTKYQQCNNSKILFQKKKEPITTEYGAFAGASFSSLKINSQRTQKFTDADFKSSTDFTFGVFLDVILPRNQKKWSIHNELQYTSYNIAGYSESYLSNGTYKTSNINFQLSYLKINNSLRFTYPIGKLKIFTNIGMSNGLALKSTNKEIKYSRFYETETITEDVALEEMRKYEQAINFGIGLKYHKYSLEGRYEIGNGMSSFANVNSTTKRYYIFAAYTF